MAYQKSGRFLRRIPVVEDWQSAAGTGEFRIIG